MELEEHVRILKMTKQQLQEELQKQNISCENKSVDEMKALLLSKLMAAGAASALTTQTSPSPKDAVRIQELELEKLRLQAEKEIELQRLRIQEEQRKEVQRQEDREARRRECEWEEKMLERKEKMQQEQRKHDLEMLRLQEESSRKINVTPKDFAPYREGEDPSIYLANFEKAAMQWGIAEAQYMAYLCSILTGELAAIYHSMPRADGGVTFKDFKATVLKRFKLGADHFRKQFRVLSPQQCKTYSEYVMKMSEMGRRWVEEAKAGDFESLFQLLVLDQLYSKLPKELKCLVKDKRPKNATEASEIADELVLNREGLDWRTSQLGREGKGFQRGGKAESQPKREGAAAPAEVKKAPDSVNWSQPQVRKCFICEGTDHLRAACPQLQVKTSKPPPKAPTSPKVKEERVAAVNHECLFTTMEPAEAWGDYVEPVRLRDQLVLGYADTGSSVTLVRADLVSESDILPNASFKIQGIGGSPLTVPVARMPVEWRGLVGLTEMGVMKDQPYPVLIGRDLLGGQYSVNVVTRSQTLSGWGEKGVSEETRTPPARGEVGTPGTTGEGGAQITQEGEGKPISETEGGVSQKAVRGGSSPPTQLEAVDLSGKEEYLSCSGGVQTGGTEVTGRGGSSPQVQQEAEGFKEAELEGAEDSFGSEEQIAECLGAPEGFLKEVQCDPSLEHLRQVAIDQEVEFSEALSEQVVWKQGRLYRLWLPQGRQVTGDAIRQLVVPRKYRRRLMELAHDIPCAGHLGINKTRQRLLLNFYWPKLAQDVRAYCNSCPICQRVGKSGCKAKAPSQPLPIMGEAFQRVGIDIVGPFPKPTQRGKRFILTLVDHATRYPEAVPLASTDAPAVAEALVKVFCQLGFPTEILTDRGRNFLSELMECLWKCCGVKHLKTTAYHPQSNGLTERFNGTLKGMLRTYVDSHPQDWDEKLPQLLFAYREVPQESTGFSPFELMFGRSVRGPLDLVKERWEEKIPKAKKSVVDYVLSFRERLKDMMSVVQENLAKAQATQSSWYDKTARSRTFELGDKVMVFLPLRSDKLKAAWEGPHVIVDRLDDVTYAVALERSGKKTKVVHVNMLKPYLERRMVLNVTRREEGDEEPDFGTIADPLSSLTKKSLPDKVVWTPVCQAAFEQLKQALVSLPVLKAPDFDRRFFVATDASDSGIGAVLMQEWEGTRHPIAYLSRKLIPREKNLSSVQKECLAIVWALDKLRPYLWGQEFTLLTDHSSLQWLQTMKNSNTKLQRWSWRIQEFNMKIEHIAGHNNVVADFLSRKDMDS
ncbi:uncharacterized protein LOC125435398 [Sphaerodactylus townsendi]|uniref:uncharacterized protein LOC125435398 n=1 Tax=Sphaerodactylus townsendi TaxID=933632 RepID=UPI00202755FE|nr:uncharacterized protein LOC125435398 [Sphaerodactylus townsendi]